MIANQCLRAFHLLVRLDRTPPDVIPVFQDHGEIIIVIIIIITIIAIIIIIIILIINLIHVD